MSWNLLLLSLRFNRTAILFWALGMVAFAVMIVALWPSYTGFEYQAIIENLPPILRDTLLGQMVHIPEAEYRAFLNWLNVEFFSWIPPLLTVYPVFTAGGAIAREAERGTLDTLLAQPISRVKIMLSKFMAFLVGLLIISISSFLGILVGLTTISLSKKPPLLGLALAHGELFLFLAAFGAIAMLLSVIFLEGSRAMGFAGVVVFVMYMLNFFSNYSEGVRGIRYASLFYYWRPQPILATGALDWQAVAVYIGVTVAALAAALVLFQKRDLVS